MVALGRILLAPFFFYMRLVRVAASQQTCGQGDEINNTVGLWCLFAFGRRRPTPEVSLKLQIEG